MVEITAGAQDPSFSQFYNSPLYLNPAFSGCAKNDFRACFTSRLQWLSLPSPLQYYTASADKYFRTMKASAGLLFNHYDEGYIKTNHAAIIGSRSFGSDENNYARWFLNFAFQLGFTQRNVDRSKLLFADQLNQSGPTGLPSEAEPFQNAKSKYFDISAGFVFTTGNIMFGAAGYHLNEPNSGLIGSTEKSKQPYRVTGHLSYVINAASASEGTVIIKPTAIIHYQGVSRSLMIGSLFDFPDSYIEIGAWYKNNIGFIDNHSISIGINIKLTNEKNYYHPEPVSRYRVGVSYDAELNRPGVRSTSGSTELGMMYEKNISQQETSCPRPYSPNETLFPWVFH